MNADEARVGMGPRYALLRHLNWPASIAFFAVFPALLLAALFVTALQIEAVAGDFSAFYGAAESVLRGDSPYVSAHDPAAGVFGSYVFPPLVALGVIPFTVLPQDVAGLLAMALLVCALLAIPFTLGVRDWRCFGLAIMWPPAIGAIQTANVTIILALGAALVWRFRDRAALCSLSAGATVALKLILWPLLVWLVATRRVAAAAISCLVGASLVLGSWAIIGFAGLTEYPDLMRRFQKAIELDCYTVYVMALDAGATPALARAIWLAVGLGLLAAVVFAGRRGDERTAFVLAIAATLALSPVVWLHYFTLLLVVVSIAQPRLGAAWFAPLAMYVATGDGHPTPFQTTATILAATLTIALCVVAMRGMSARPLAASRLPAPSERPPAVSSSRFTIRR
ncbi:MAG: glycosyltransferase 87 family protein [Gaiellaceae bacterium]